MDSPSDLENILAPFLGAESAITSPISTLSVVFFLYGVYCIIFGLSIHALFRNGSTSHKLYTGCSIALFVLATIYTAVNTWGTTRQAFIVFHTATTKDYTPFIQYLEGDDRKTAWNSTMAFISTLMNSIADTMLIHRCYVIFNYNKLVLFPLGFAAFILNGIDLGVDIAIATAIGSSTKIANSTVVTKGQSIDDGAMIGLAVLQIVLAFMTGGRIWWITRQARQLMEGSARTRYNGIVVIIIESGLLYAGSLLATVVVQDAVDPHLTGVTPFDTTVISTLLSGLAPTMVIARVASRKSVDSVQQTVSTLHFAQAQAGQQRATGVTQATIDLQIQTQPGLGHNLEEPSIEKV